MLCLLAESFILMQGRAKRFTIRFGSNGKCSRVHSVGAGFTLFWFGVGTGNAPLISATERGQDLVDTRHE